MENKDIKMILSAGALFKAENTQKYFLIQRASTTSYSNKFSLVGGKVHIGEKLLEGLTREIKEEIGFVPTILKWAPFNCYTSMDKKFQYTSIIILTPNEFLPKLNHENDGYCWVKDISTIKTLHPRLKEVISSSVLLNGIKNFS